MAGQCRTSSCKLRGSRVSYLMRRNEEIQACTEWQCFKTISLDLSSLFDRVSCWLNNPWVTTWFINVANLEHSKSAACSLMHKKLALDDKKWKLSTSLTNSLTWNIKNIFWLCLPVIHYLYCVLSNQLFIWAGGCIYKMLKCESVWVWDRERTCACVRWDVRYWAFY